MSISATRVGTQPSRGDSQQRTCPRCGVTRSVTRPTVPTSRVCGSCADEIRDLGEEHLWEAKP